MINSFLKKLKSQNFSDDAAASYTHKLNPNVKITTAQILATPLVAENMHVKLIWLIKRTNNYQVSDRCSASKKLCL